MPIGVNQDSIINHLLDWGIITRGEIRGRYNVPSVQLVNVRRAVILSLFTEEPEPGRHIWRQARLDRARRMVREGATMNLTEFLVEEEPQQRPVLRTITRYGYHCAHRDIQGALSRIPYDDDSVRRSFGIEYEVYSLNPEQEDKLARLLDTLPEHVTERDGSLGTNGVEIVFAPMSAQCFVDTVRKLRAFVEENHVRMGQDETYMAGMHITYGVSNATSTRSDEQIRLNRFALAVKSVGTQREIKSLFGRDFGHYRDLPTSTTYSCHSNAFSNSGRNETCWECRLADYRCDAERMVEFFKATECIFYRPVKAEDFMKVFEILGANTDGQ